MNIGAIKTPIGQLGLVEENGHITQLMWDARDKGERTPVLQEGLRQLGEFFDSTHETFDLPLASEGTAFQQQVFAAMLAIPKGETRTYGSIAQELGVPAQPLGQACESNPIPVIIPCHRVVGADGLGGLSGDGGVEMKIALLKLEQAYSLLF